MPKPKGTMGATKMKVMAIICHNCEYGNESYGYNIWQSLKGVFHIYLNDCDVRNVYHHLKELCELDLAVRIEGEAADSNTRCLYRLTEKGESMRDRYSPYLEIVHRNYRAPSKY